MEQVWTPRRQGDLGEISAIEWLCSRGAWVSLPMFSHPHYDVIADWGGRIERVQVKSSVQWRRGRYVVSVCTRGGNQSWNRIVKRMDASRCDFVFVHVVDGRRWYLPSGALGGTTSICLGGDKYAEFEVEPGRPLPPRDPAVAVARR